ncbi:hypothetical protein F0562_019853 [Nyssa sinensis]|uniref:non-specific serine/threonine protein kinase n=1 Tax=Nyssa sinensis TaxID=561372 RepID=A0A5J5BQC1_9ASTE|nr:hypothetical protein F0562_019853 [Nyssa sinensis]
MSVFLSIFIALGLGLGLGFYGYSFPIANGMETLPDNPSDASCPLNFNVLRKLITESDLRPALVDVPRHCQYVLEELIHLVRAEYLRTNGRFHPPSTASEACWVSFRSLVSEFVPNFDINSVCGNHPEWISQAYLNAPENGNDSDCTAYPFMYAAAFINQFGPTDLATANCLFSLRFSSWAPINKRHIVAVSGAIIGSIIGFIGACMAILCLRRMQKEWNREKKNISKIDSIETGVVSELRSIGGNTSLINYKFEEIKHATMNFSRENLIGKGGYGNVYKGILEDGSEVAVKRFKNCSVSGDRTFAHEVEVIASVRHVNLVALRGYCTATAPLGGHQRIIVCDLMHNGSLYDHLFGSEVKRLSWPIRQKIAIGTARGLAYLHYGAQPAIIHRDIKASNILLDESFEPKVADFGLAKFNPKGMTHLSTRVAGTLGYVAPEYALYGKLTEGSDVYSFGVVLLELLSGKKVLLSSSEGKTSLLTDWAWSLVQKGKALDVIEEDMPEMGLPEVMEQYVFIAVFCCHPNLHSRPTMDQIVKLLEGNMPVPLIPECQLPLLSHITNNEQLPPTSDEERDLEDDFMRGGVHVSGNTPLPDSPTDDNLTPSNRKRGSDGGPPSRHKKGSKCSSMEKAFEAWTAYSIA